MRKLPRKEIVCICGKKLLVKINSSRKYCSQACSKTKPSWNKGLTKETCPKLREVGKKIKQVENDPKWKETIGAVKKEKIFQAKLKNPPTSWNKGLTKETSEILRETGKKISRSYALKPEEEKERLRENARIKTLERIAKNPHKRFHNTKPEREFKDRLFRLGLDFKQNYPTWRIKHCYPADFYLPDYNLIIEIDGEKWHNFPLGLEKDHVRADELMGKGYFVLRIWVEALDCLEDAVFLEYLENIKILIAQENQKCRIYLRAN